MLFAAAFQLFFRYAAIMMLSPPAADYFALLDAMLMPFATDAIFAAAMLLAVFFSRHFDYIDYAAIDTYAYAAA